MNEKSNKTSPKEWGIFLAMAYGLTILMAIPLGICQRAGYATDVFPSAQMFYPAAGVMLAGLLAGGKKENMPVRFFAVHLLTTAVLIIMCVLAVFVHSVDWTLAANYAMIIGSVVAWVVLLTEKKKKREAQGLRWHGGFAKPAAMVLLFVLIKVATVAVSVIIDGSAEEYLAYVATPTPWIVLAVLLPNFFLSCLPFFGEEYGWRYWLQPRLQQKFGLRKGVLLLGVVWGLWHLPLNLFYYSPETSLQSIAAQLVTCVSLGIFFAYAYMKTNNIWVPVILHYLNNNLIVVFSGSAQISNQVYTWKDILLVFVIDAVFFLPFLLTKEFRAKAAAPVEPVPQSDL